MGNIPDREEDGGMEGVVDLPPQVSEDEVDLAKRTFAMDLCRLRETIKQRWPPTALLFKVLSFSIRRHGCYLHSANKRWHPHTLKTGQVGLLA